MFSIAVAPFYNPINSACKRFQLLHILTNTCYFLGLGSFFFLIVTILVSMRSYLIVCVCMCVCVCVCVCVKLRSNVKGRYH